MQASYHSTIFKLSNCTNHTVQGTSLGLQWRLCQTGFSISVASLEPPHPVWSISALLVFSHFFLYSFQSALELFYFPFSLPGMCFSLFLLPYLTLELSSYTSPIPFLIYPPPLLPRGPPMNRFCGTLCFSFRALIMVDKCMFICGITHWQLIPQAPCGQKPCLRSHHCMHSTSLNVGKQLPLLASSQMK